MRRSSWSIIFSSLLVSASLTTTALEARQFAPKQQPAPGATAAATAPAPVDENTVQLPLYTGASDKSARVTVSKVVYADNKEEFLPKDPNWAQLTITFENTGKAPVTLDSIKVKQNSGMMHNSASSTIQLAKAPDTVGQVGKASGIMAAGQFAGAFLFPPLAILSSAFAMFGLGNSQKKWEKQMAAIEASALATGTVPSKSMISGNVYLPAVADQKELVFLYTINGKTSELAVPVSGYQTVELKKKKKKK
jgi:hypothetical protein